METKLFRAESSPFTRKNCNQRSFRHCFQMYFIIPGCREPSICNSNFGVKNPVDLVKPLKEDQPKCCSFFRSKLRAGRKRGRANFFLATRYLTRAVFEESQVKNEKAKRNFQRQKEMTLSSINKERNTGNAFL